jgi:hypothetical protein
MAPEYAMAGLFSVKSDVFSFGVLVLEIVYGKRNGEVFFSEHGQSLLLYVSFFNHTQIFILQHFLTKCCNSNF